MESNNHEHVWRAIIMNMYGEHLWRAMDINMYEEY